MTDYVIRIVVNGQDNASAPLGRVGSALGNMAQIAGGILSAQTLSAIGRGIMDMGREALDATASWERMGLAMQSMIAREMVNTGEMKNLTEAMGAASPKAEELLHWLEGLAINSPFDADGVANTYRMGLTFGFTSDKAKTLTQVLIDMSSGMGLTSFQMERVGYALGQINSADRVLMQDLRQLMNAGVPVNDILKTMGYTLADVGKESIDSKAFVDAFLKTMGDGFTGAAEKQAKSWAGLLNSMSDIKKIGLREFFSSTFDAIQPLIAKFVDKFSDPAFIDSLRKWGEPLGNFVKQAVRLFEQFDRLKKNLPTINLSMIFEKIKNSDFFANITKAFENFKRFFDENGAKILDILQNIGERVIEAFGPVVADIVLFLSEQLLKVSEWVNDNGDLILEFLEVMGEFFSQLAEAVAGAWEWIEPILTGIFDLLLGLATLIMQVATGDWAGAWETIQQIASDVWEALKTAFWEFLDWLANIMGSSLEEIGMVWASNWEQFKTILATVWNLMVAWVTQKISDLGMAVMQGIYNTYTTWVSNWEQFKTIIANVWSIIVAWVNEKVNALKTAISNFVMEAKLQWQRTWDEFKNILGNAWNAIASTLTSKFAEVTSMIRSKVSEFIKVGKDIVKGLENGIKEAWSGLMTTLEGLVNEMKGTVQSALGIFSPSKVFHEYGKNIMEGWQQGLIQNSSLPINATLQTAGAVAQAAATSKTVNNNWNVTIHPQQSAGSAREDIRLLQLAAGA